MKNPGLSKIFLFFFFLYLHNPYKFRYYHPVIAVAEFLLYVHREKKLLVGSDDYGRDLTGVQNLKKKHKRLEAELGSHEPAIQSVQEAGEKLMDVSNLGVPEIEQRLKLLNQAWSELKQMAANRGQKLDESLTYQQFLARVEEEEAWISEKQQLLGVEDYGDTMAAVQGLLKKHDAFETDFSAHRGRCGDIGEAGEKLVNEGNHHAVSIQQRCQTLQVNNSKFT